MIKRIAIALLPIATIAVVVWLAVPEYRALQVAKLDRENAIQALEAKRTLIADIKVLEAQFDQVGDVAPRVARVIPTTPEVPNLLIEVPEMVLQSGMALNDIVLNAREDAVPAKQEAQGALPFKTMEMRLSVSGSFESFLIFLRNVEQNLRIMDVQTVSFTIPQWSAGTLQPYKFNIQARLYFGLSV